MTSANAERNAARRRSGDGHARPLAIAQEPAKNLPTAEGVIVPSPLLQQLPRGLANAFHRLVGQRNVDGATPLPGRVGVVSSLHGNGVSTVARALAITLTCDLDSTVCIVDISKPSGSPKGRSTEPAIGLADVLAGDASLAEALHASADDRLQMIAAGAGDADTLGSVLRSRQFVAVLDELERQFDYVVIDAPPVLQTPDALAALRHVEGYFLVARHGKTPVDEVRTTTSQLEPLPCLGVILNRYSTRIPKRFQRIFAP